MENLLSTGLQLMFVGMGVVFAFLVLLVLTIKLIARLLDNYMPVQITPAPIQKQHVTMNNTSEVTAAISIAIHKYRNSKHKNKL